ncbi:MAG: SlyX family protein [Xanthomonadales bacterium]|jgi:SlyX protein|nr:SlyX family protein [Xanthomonadales bacterium]
MNERSDRERIDDLESRLAFQDDLIESLNEVVARQDREILRLTQRLAELAAKIEDVAASSPAASGEGYEPPPHY